MNKITITNEESKETNSMMIGIALKIKNVKSIDIIDYNISNDGIIAICRMKDLVNLTINNCNRISNTGWDAISSMVSLRSLTVINCDQFNDRSCLYLIASRLTSLTLVNVNISDVGVKYISFMDKLIKLSIHLCDHLVKEEYLSHLYSMSSLKELSLEGLYKIDNINNAFDGIANMVNLESLTIIEFLYMPNTALTNIGLIPELRMLELDGCGNIDINVISEMSALEKLKLIDCNIHGHIDMINNLTNLSELLIDNCEIDSVLTTITLDLEVLHLVCTEINIPDNIYKLTTLRSLNLSSTIPITWLEHIDSLVNLESLILSNCVQFTNDTLLKVSKLTKLRELNVSYTGITDIGVTYISNMRRLRTLNISGCNITDIGILTLQHLDIEKLLLLGIYELTDDSCVSLSNMRNLSHLHIVSSQFTCKVYKLLSHINVYSPGRIVDGDRVIITD